MPRHPPFEMDRPLPHERFGRRHTKHEEPTHAELMETLEEILARLDRIEGPK